MQLPSHNSVRRDFYCAKLTLALDASAMESKNKRVWERLRTALKTYLDAPPAAYAAAVVAICAVVEECVETNRRSGGNIFPEPMMLFFDNVLKHASLDETPPPPQPPLPSPADMLEKLTSKIEAYQRSFAS